jgi:hypothetical protein
MAAVLHIGLERQECYFRMISNFNLESFWIMRRSLRCVYFPAAERATRYPRSRPDMISLLLRSRPWRGMGEMTLKRSN